jgi:hypothetical protein
MSRPVVCDAASYLDGIIFPSAFPRVMAAERTCWEKATAAHVYWAQGRLRGERYSRCWHDLARLDFAGLADEAIADRALARTVCPAQAMFFREP